VIRASPQPRTEAFPSVPGPIRAGWARFPTRVYTFSSRWLSPNGSCKPNCFIPSLATFPLPRGLLPPTHMRPLSFLVSLLRTFSPLGRPAFFESYCNCPAGIAPTPSAVRRWLVMVTSITGVLIRSPSFPYNIASLFLFSCLQFGGFAAKLPCGLPTLHYFACKFPSFPWQPFFGAISTSGTAFG